MCSTAATSCSPWSRNSSPSCSAKTSTTWTRPARANGSRRKDRSANWTSARLRIRLSHHVGTHVRSSLDGVALEAASLPLGQPAPDAESLVVLQRVLEALAADFAAGADPLRLARRAALLREERFWIGLRAERSFLPALLLGQAEDLARSAAPRLLAMSVMAPSSA